jgi:hypothetical protein
MPSLFDPRANRLPRDSFGWRVPRAGTKSWTIYHHLLQGKRRAEITAATGFDPRVVGVLTWKIKHPGIANARGRR